MTGDGSRLLALRLGATAARRPPTAHRPSPNLKPPPSVSVYYEVHRRGGIRTMRGKWFATAVAILFAVVSGVATLHADDPKPADKPGDKAAAKPGDKAEKPVPQKFVRQHKA